ncbi:MAG: PEP-CTERM sorting domain-containing protein [Aquabacterium sp.]
MLKLNSLALAAIAAVTLASASAHAGLLGSSATSQYYAYGGAYNGGGSPDTFVVDGGAHAPFFNYYTIIVTDTQIIYDYQSASTWSSSGVSLNTAGLYIDNGNLLSFVGAPSITSVTVDGSTNMGGFGAGNVTFNAGAVAVSWANLSFDDNTQVVLNINTMVPEPGTYALMALGLVGVAAVARRRRQA